MTMCIFIRNVSISSVDENVKIPDENVCNVVRKLRRTYTQIIWTSFRPSVDIGEDTATKREEKKNFAKTVSQRYQETTR